MGDNGTSKESEGGVGYGEDPDLGERRSEAGLQKDARGTNQGSGVHEDEKALGGLREAEARGEGYGLDDTECHDVEETPRAVVRAHVAEFWSGRLPHPDDFAKYPPEAQRAILRQYEVDMEHLRDLAKSDMELDRAQSKRMDRSQELESKSIDSAQVWTGVLNILLLIVGLALGIMGFAAASIAAFGALAVINVSAFLPEHLGGKGKRKKSGA